MLVWWCGCVRVVITTTASIVVVSIDEVGIVVDGDLLVVVSVVAVTAGVPGLSDRCCW